MGFGSSPVNSYGVPEGWRRELLSMRLIANLATVDDDESIHLVPMWFLRIGDDILTDDVDIVIYL
jgi:hypothetical protein